MSTIEVTRQELYELVWETPTRHLCKRFGLSDVGLAKTCKRLEIPRPSYGYWAKKAAGGKVKRAPLPRCDNPQLQKIVFAPTEAKTEEDDGFFDRQIRDLYELESQAEPIEVGDSLRSPHPLVARTRDALAGAKPSEWSRIPGHLYPDARDGVQLLDIVCSKATLPRALRVMDALVKGLEKRGYKFGSSDDSYRSGIAAKGHGYEFVFRLREPTKRQIQPKKHSWDSQYAYVLTGELQLEIDFMYRMPRVCRDSTKKKIEDYVRELPRKMLLVIDDYRREMAKQAEEQRRRDEIRRQKEEEAERKARREKLLQKRRENREQLFRTAEQWQRSQLLRAFIEAVRTTAIERAGGTKLHPDTVRWLEWATKTADRADPIEQMKADSDRQKRMRKPK